jgi:hypothetical protein
MGLRLVAHYYEPVEALVARSVVEAAGMLAILQNYEWLSVLPHHTGALGGYRLVVSEFDLEDAVAVLRDALVSPAAVEGEKLKIETTWGDRVSSLFWGLLAGGAPMPVRGSQWWPAEE